MKKPLKPLTIQTPNGEVTLLCKHRNEWPPIYAFLGESFDDLRASRDIDDRKYQQLKVWESTCGLKAMSEDKCPNCPLAMVETNGAEVSYVRNMKIVHPPFARSKINVHRHR